MYSCFSFADREERNRCVCKIFHRYIQGKVLDVGCDERYIFKYAICDYYIGIDLYGKPDIRVDLEDGLPFLDRAFDTVICLEVLEHIDHFHFLFNELCRVAKHYVIIGLPNMYYWRWL